MSRGTLLLAGLVLFCCTIELVLILFDTGLAGAVPLRRLAYDYGGFWPGLLRGWKPNYPAQPVLMFFTYGFLHGGALHLAVNMVTLWSLGRAVLARVGVRGFALLYVGALLGGAAGFGLLAPGLRPMVGASGALFGLAGGLLAWAYVDRYTHHQGLWPVARAVLLLAGLNLAMWWAMAGHLAWQTHLGGFLAGWVLALLIDPRAAEIDEQGAAED